MKPSIVVQPLKADYSFLDYYPILENVNIAANSSVSVDFRDFKQYRFTCTLEKFFSASFLDLVKAGSITLRSVSTYSNQSELSVSLDLQGNLLLTMSDRLYESTGLDAAHVIVDSVHFSSTTRLLSFDLIKLAKEDAHLTRIRQRSALLASQVFSCDFVALSKGRLDKILGVTVAEEPLPVIRTSSIESFGWLEEDSCAILQEKIEWMSMSVKKPSSSSGSNSVSGMSLYSIEGPLLPSFLISQIIDNCLPQATHFVLSARAPASLSPHPHLNRLREAHFSASKYDPTTAAADQQGFLVLKSPTECSLFTLNTTA